MMTYCSFCGGWHSDIKPVHRRPIRRLLGKLKARAAVIRRLLNETKVLQASIENRVSRW